MTVLVGDYWQGWFPLQGHHGNLPAVPHICVGPHQPFMAPVPKLIYCTSDELNIHFFFFYISFVCLASNHLSLLPRAHANLTNLPCLFSKSVLVKGWALSFSSSAVRLILLGTSLEALN